jgi:hypothetical protein
LGDSTVLSYAVETTGEKPILFDRVVIKLFVLSGQFQFPATYSAGTFKWSIPFITEIKLKETGVVLRRAGSDGLDPQYVMQKAVIFPVIRRMVVSI